jgi:hypothetical protein
VDQTAASAGAGLIDPEFTAYPLRELAAVAAAAEAVEVARVAAALSAERRPRISGTRWKPSAARRPTRSAARSTAARASLRWAANTLTTNGVSRTRQLTVIAVSRRGDGASAGVVSRAGVRDDQITDLVRAAEQAAADGSPAPDAQPLTAPGSTALGSTGRSGSAGWDEPVTGTGIGVFGSFAPALGTAFSLAASGGRKLYGFAEHSVTSTFLGSSSGLRLPGF